MVQTVLQGEPLPADERGAQLNARTATALAELTSAERQVADLLPIEADPSEARDGSRRRSVLVSHLCAQSGGGDLRAGTCARPSLPAPGDPGELRGSLRSRHRQLRRVLRLPRRGPGGRAGGRHRQRAVHRVGPRPLGRRARGRGGFPGDPRPARLESPVPQARRPGTRPTRRALRLHLLLRDPASRRDARTPTASAQPPPRRGRQGFDRDARRLSRIRPTAIRCTATGRARSTRTTTTSIGASRPPGSRCSGVKAASSASSSSTPPWSTAIRASSAGCGAEQRIRLASRDCYDPFAGISHPLAPASATLRSPWQAT